jgi:NifU-like protein involved in Fe-S cluster formation
MSALYTPEILRLAVSIAHLGRLEGAYSSVEKRAPVCGSRVRLDYRLDDAGRIVAFAQEVNACALGQASAALLGARVIGSTAADIEAALAYLQTLLSGEAVRESVWPSLEIFTPAIDYPARHGAILLPFAALAAGLNDIQTGVTS